MDNPSDGVRRGGHGESDGTGQPADRRSAINWVGNRVLAGIRQARAFAAGFQIGLSVWTPVFVATAAEDSRLQQYGLPGALVMFGAGAWLRMGRRSLRGPAVPMDSRVCGARDTALRNRPAIQRAENASRAHFPVLQCDPQLQRGAIR